MDKMCRLDTVIPPLLVGRDEEMQFRRRLWRTANFAWCDYGPWLAPGLATQTDCAGTPGRLAKEAPRLRASSKAMYNEHQLHPDTKALIASWRAIRFGGSAPGVASSTMDLLVRRIFVLEAVDSSDADGAVTDFRLRMSGESLSALFQRELKSTSFSHLFAANDRPLLQATCQMTCHASDAAAMLCRAETASGLRLDAEIALFPLGDPPALGRRLLGLFQPLAPESIISGRPIVRVRILAAYPPEFKSTPRLRVVQGDRA